jgi:CBS domain containing-hemolysin-like protein
LKNTGLLRRLLGAGARSDRMHREPVSNEEIRAMIEGVHALAETTVKEVMVPRIDSVFLGLDMSEQELVGRIAETGHSRFPVYRDTIDNVVGMLYAKDLLQYLTNGETISIDKLLRKPYFVPESKRLDSLLREMKRRRVHIAIAVDEYGGVSGIVCLEDIIEEIVGDIQDEFDNEREDIVTIGDHVFLCDARVNLEDLAETIGYALPNEDYDTLGGFVFDLFGRIPVKFEKVRYRNIDCIIQEMDGHKIRSVKLVVHPHRESDDEE